MSDRLPVVNSDKNTWGTILNQFLTDNIPWTVPENWGTIGGGADGATINAAIAGLQQTGKASLLVMPGRYTIEQTVIIPGNPPVHMWWVNGAMSRQANPPTFSGARWNPAAGFLNPMLQIGTAGNNLGNPNGTQLINPSFNGRDPNGGQPNGLVGVLLQDTSDVVLDRPQMANFDPAGSGVALFNQATVSVGGAGMIINKGVFQNNFVGVIQDGLGSTDMRFWGTLFRLNHHGIDMGPSASGGGGLQLMGCHFVHGSAVAGDFALQLGFSAGDCQIEGNYFDTYGVANPVVNITCRNYIMNNNHFLASGLATGVMVQASHATQQGTFIGNNCNGNASAMTALLKCSGKAGAPSNGVYLGNNVYNHTGSLIAALIDSANVAIPATATATTYVQGNVSE